MLTKLHHLFTGIVIVATLLTVAVYLWALNSSTLYERVEPSPVPTSETP